MRRTAMCALSLALLLCAGCGQEAAPPTPSALPSAESETEPTEAPGSSPSAEPEVELTGTSGVTPGQAASTVDIPDKPYSYLTNEYQWFTLGDAYTAAMDPYETWHEYKYDEGTTLLIAPKETLTDVSFCTMDMDENGAFVPAEVFYTIGELTPEKPMVLSVQFYGSMTTYGMSFTAANGSQHDLMITMGGRGPDEACPYSAMEY